MDSAIIRARRASAVSSAARCLRARRIESTPSFDKPIRAPPRILARSWRSRCASSPSWPGRAPRKRTSRPRPCRRRSRRASPARLAARMGAGQAHRTQAAHCLRAGAGRRRRRAARECRRRGERSRAVHDLRHQSAPIVEWRWKVSSMIEGADNRVAAQGGFAGAPDLRVRRRQVEAAAPRAGRLLHHGEALRAAAALRAAPVHLGCRHSRGHLIEHPHTRRVRMLVVASGAGGVGTLAVDLAQSAQRLPPRVPRGAGPAHRRRRADGHRQHRRLGGGVVRRHPVRAGGALDLERHESSREMDRD